MVGEDRSSNRTTENLGGETEDKLCKIYNEWKEKPLVKIHHIHSAITSVPPAKNFNLE